MVAPIGASRKGSNAVSTPPEPGTSVEGTAPAGGSAGAGVRGAVHPPARDLHTPSHVHTRAVHDPCDPSRDIGPPAASTSAARGASPARGDRREVAAKRPAVSRAAEASPFATSGRRAAAAESLAATGPRGPVGGRVPLARSRGRPSHPSLDPPLRSRGPPRRALRRAAGDRAGGARDRRGPRGGVTRCRRVRSRRRRSGGDRGRVHRSRGGWRSSPSRPRCRPTRPVSGRGGRSRPPGDGCRSNSRPTRAAWGRTGRHPAAYFARARRWPPPRSSPTQRRRVLLAGTSSGSPSGHRPGLDRVPLRSAPPSIRVHRRPRTGPIRARRARPGAAPRACRAGRAGAGATRALLEVWSRAGAALSRV